MGQDARLTLPKYGMHVGRALTWFEADTAVAFLALADHHIHHGGLTILECGMGGASDATALAPHLLRLS